MTINKVVLHGRIAGEPRKQEVGEKRTTLVSFPVEFQSTGTSEEHTRSHQITVKLWGKRAEFFATLPQGTEMLIDGQLQEERWKDKASGDWKGRFVINPRDIQLAGKRGE